MAKDKVETVEVEEVVDAPKKEKSQAYLQLEAIIEAYKVSNPAKYELKKDELARKLAAL